MTVGVDVPQTGFDALSIQPQEMTLGLQPEEQEAFRRYILMHKVFVGECGAHHLLGLHPQLSGGDVPTYLVAGGWAAAEAAVILGGNDKETGEQLLGIAQDAWLRAIAHQKWINIQERHPLEDAALAYRTANDIAFLPVFSEIIRGGVQNRTLAAVFADVLNIAQMADVNTQLAFKEGDVRVAGDLRGFSYETNGLLAYNRRRSGKWIAIPALSRADNGIYHPEQTHDLVVIRQHQGEIVNAVPIEVKATATKQQRRRYLSLLIRSKLHLSLPGRHEPGQVLEAITADYEGTATKEQRAIVTKASETIYDMVGDYLKGQPRHDVASPRSVVRFRDKHLVTRRYPGLHTE